MAQGWDQKIKKILSRILSLKINLKTGHGDNQQEHHIIHGVPGGVDLPLHMNHPSRKGARYEFH